MEWQPIKMAPEEEHVLVFDGERICIAYHYLDPWNACCPHAGWWEGITSGNRREVKPTHWMPLPKPPKKKK